MLLARGRSRFLESAAAESWTEDEIKGIQRQLRRLRLHELLIDGAAGLMKALGSEKWRPLDPA